VKTDSLFYSIFQTMPTIFFELLGKSTAEAEGYRFTSVELKQTALRIDGVFLPPDNQPDAPVYFLEVQFQQDPLLYRRLFSEVLLYLKQYTSVKRWQAVVIYPSPSVEVPEPETFGEWMASSYIQVIYLNQLAAMSALSPELGLLRLIVEPKNTLPAAARGLIAQVKQSGAMEVNQAQLVELIETIVIYAFPKLSRQEIAAMIEVFDIKETRFYQETREEDAKKDAKKDAKQRPERWCCASSLTSLASSLRQTRTGLINCR
jgi:predicted transposase/invertase (TIGR01784 family)